MTPKTPSPPSNMEVETLCFGGVFLLRGKDNCPVSPVSVSKHTKSAGDQIITFPLYI